MSWHWYTYPCPVCWEDMDVYEDSKPFPTANCRCNRCWFVSSNEIDRMSLSEVNDSRKDDEKELMTQEEYDSYNDDSFFSWLTFSKWD